jgi:hypothetical protein
MKKLSRVISQYRLFFLIFILAAIIRFYRLAEVTSFDFDQEYASNFAYSVVKEFPIQLIGQGLSVQGLFMGPLYFYFLVPFFILFKLHPLGGAVGSVVLGLITVFAYYYYGGKIFNKSTGLLAAFFRAILFSKLQVDWSMVPAYSSEILVLITWYYFYRYWRGDTKSLPVLGLIFGLYTSIHPILFPFYLVFLSLAILVLLLKKTIFSLRTFLLSICAFIIPNLPLLLFEYFHNFLEVKRLIGVFSKGSESISFSLTRLIKFLSIIFGELYFVLGLGKPKSQVIGSSISLIVLLIMVILTYKKRDIWKESFHLIGLCLSILVFLSYYYFFPTHVIEYYFLGPTFLLFFYFLSIIRYLLTIKRLRILVVVGLILISYRNLWLLWGNWRNPGHENLAHKDRIIKKIIQDLDGRKDFSVSYINLPGWNFGFNYLFKYYGYLPKDKFVEGANYTIVNPKELSKDSINYSYGNIGLIVPK